MNTFCSNESASQPITITDFGRICRTCLGDSDVHQINSMTIDGVQASDLLHYSVQIKIEYPDRLPQNLCIDCLKELYRSYEFKILCQKNEATLRKLIQEADELAVYEVKDISINLHDVPDENDISTDMQDESIDCNLSENKIESFILNEDSSENGNYDATSEDEIEEEEVNRKRNQNPKQRSVTFNCNECLIKFETRDLLLAHRKEMKHGPFRKDQCEICNKLVMHRRMKDHIKTHTEQIHYKCEICSMSFSLQGNLKRHIMRHTGERPYVCAFCGKGFIQNTSLKTHEKIHVKNEKGNKRFYCNFCGRSFNRENAFKAHMGRHGDNSSEVCHSDKEDPWEGIKYICEICSKGYKTKHLLKLHRLRHGDKNYLCSDCGRGFYTKERLKKHSLMHTNEKPYTCEICNKSFRQSVNYDSHMRIHSGSKPHRCKFCQKAFTQLTHLTYHLRTHTGEKPYECSFCGKRFAVNGNLTVHTRTHTGETPYLCNVCGKGFYDSSSMKRHRATHKKDDDNSQYMTIYHMDGEDESKVLIEKVEILTNESDQEA